MQYITSKSSKLASMITSRTAIASLVLGFLAFAVGCDSTGVITEPIAPQSKEATVSPATIQPSVIDGRIVFDDTDEFRVFMASIINRSDTYLDSVETAIDFMSLRSDTDRLAEELEKDVDELEVVEDPFFATVLNPEGEFQVEDMIYKITKNYVYRVREENVDHLNPISLRNHEQVVLTQKTAHDPIVETFEVERASMEPAKTSGSRDSCTSYFNGRRRIKGQAWISYWHVFASATSEIESQRKSWGRWWRTNINWVRLDMDYSVARVIKSPYQYGPPDLVINLVEGSFTKTKYSASEVRKNLDWNVGINQKADKIKGWISSTYTGNRTDDNITRTRSCSTYVSRK